ncbi:hypothetical protein F0562_004843 [Nyssa sinensis]|uniref:Uncharacterized protein n=1 Tax=Nyssa sinensis TaxID=561372 RepID=A0A5J5AIS6_9ASTE|nr:hypothetical protein F0562_004843 [Nyssa sinensis]
MGTIGKELIRVELRNDSLEDFVANRREDFLVIFKAQGFEDVRESGNLGTREDTEGEIHHLEVLGAGDGGEGVGPRSDVENEGFLEPWDKEVSPLTDSFVDHSTESIKENGALTAVHSVEGGVEHAATSLSLSLSLSLSPFLYPSSLRNPRIERQLRKQGRSTHHSVQTQSRDTEMAMNCTKSLRSITIWREGVGVVGHRTFSAGGGKAKKGSKGGGAADAPKAVNTQQRSQVQYSGWCQYPQGWSRSQNLARYGIPRLAVASDRQTPSTE